MTISTAIRTAGPFTGNGVTVTFPFTYKVFTRADVLVATTVTATAVETVRVLDSDYTVTLNADQNSNPGGVINMATAPPVGTTLAATSNIAIVQALDLTNQGGFYPKTINDALDRMVINIQQLAAKIGAGALNVGSAANIVGILNTLLTLAGNTGSSLVGFIQAGTGALLRAVQDRLRESISVFDYMTAAQIADIKAGTASIDCTAAIQNAITYAAQAQPNTSWLTTVTGYAAPRAVVFPSGVYKVSGAKILVPSALLLRGKNATMVGTGFTPADNICFESGYLSAGAIVTNIGTAYETQRLQFTGIEGFRFTKFKRAINLQNFNEGCYARDCAFFDCLQNVYGDRVFYAEFSNLFSRGAAGGTALAAYYLTNAVNSVYMRRVCATDRVLVTQVDNGSYALNIQDCDFEGSTNGIKFTNEVAALTIKGCYFEALTGTAIDMTDSVAKLNIDIDNNWFFTVGTAISGVAMLGGTIGRGNYYRSVTNRVVIGDNVSTVRVEIEPIRIADNSVSLFPSLPAGYTLGTAVEVSYPYHIYSNVTGQTIARQEWNPGTMAFPFSGKHGYAQGKVLFCNHTKTAGTAFNVVVDTKIAYDGFVPYIFSISIIDNVAAYTINGHGYGPNVYLDGTPGKTVTAANNAGFLQLTFAAFSHPASTYGCEGFVRMP